MPAHGLHRAPWHTPETKVCRTLAAAWDSPSKDEEHSLDAFSGPLREAVLEGKLNVQ